MTTPRKAVTLGDGVAAYLASIRVEGTRKVYSKSLEPLSEHFGPGLPLKSLDAREVGEWLAERWGYASSGTYNTRAAAVRSAAAWWDEAKGSITTARAVAIRKAAADVKNRPVLPAEPLTPAEVAALLAGTDPARPSRWGPVLIRNRAIIMLLYRSGLRLGELLAIMPGDVDMTRRSIRLRGTKGGPAQVRYFHESARDALAHWIDRRAQLGINGHHPVFCTLKGQPLDESYVRRMLRQHARSAGITKRVHPHGLRHTFAVEMEAAGLTVSEISRLLGHSSAAVTAGYLNHLTNYQAGQALARADLPGAESREAAGAMSVAGLMAQGYTREHAERFLAQMQEQVAALMAGKQDE